MKNPTAEIFLPKHESLSKEESLNLILNNIDEVFILIDKEFKIITINEMARQKVRMNLGLHIREGMSVLEMVEPERRELMISVYHEVLNGVEKITETEYKFPNGILTFNNCFRPARNQKGEIVGIVICSRDVTEQKKAAEILKEIEERWRFALEGAKQGVWDWNMLTGDVFYSNSYKRLYGYKDDELKGRIEEWEQMVHPDDKAKMDQAVKDHTGAEDPYYESTYRIRTTAGDYKWVLARGMLLGKDKAGNPLRMIGTHTDITDQVLAEQKIKESEQRYRSLFQANPLPCWIYDAETFQFLEVNRAAIAHYGYSREEFIKAGLGLIHDEQYHDKLEERLKSEKNKRSVAVNNWQHKKKNGQTIFVDLRINSIDYKGAQAKLVVAHDVTSKVVAENELKKSNERFRTVSRATSDAIYEWDMNSNGLHWGEGICTLFGYNEAELSVDAWSKLIHPDDNEKVYASLFEALEDRTRNFWKEEYQFKKADGNYSYVLDRGFIIRNEFGKAIRMIGSMQDISERKYYEQILSLEKYVFELSTNPKLEFNSILNSLLRGFEAIHPDAYTSVQTLRDDQTMAVLAAPRLPHSYSNALNGLKVGPAEGSCGTAMYAKRTVIVDDIETDPLWKKYKQLVAPLGLKACCSLPIIHGSGKVVGSFAVYYKENKSPTETELSTIERMRNLLRVLMEHTWSLEELKLANERFDIMMKATHDLVWDWNLETSFIYRDEIGLQQVYGVSSNSSIDNIFKWVDRVHPEDRERVQKVMNAIMQATTQDIFDVEYRFRGDDGNYTFVYDRGKIIRNNKGKPVRMIGAVQNITERKRLEHELLQNELERQKAINQATVDTQEQERGDIGKELHDNVNQVLTTTKLYLDLALSNAELKDQLIQKSTKNIISVINEIRQLSRSLMDPSIGDLGLIDSIHDLIENINLTRKLHVSLTANRKIETLLNKNQKLTVFRIIQEALNNAIRHAKATTVVISFKRNKNNLDIIIKDDGIGFNHSLVKKGAGLKNIQNRVYLINGSHSLKSEPGKGCELVISFPLI